MRQLIIALAAVFVTTSTVDAQTCSGAAPFNRGPVRVGVGFSYSDAANSYGGGLGIGSSRDGPFATANGFAIEYDGIEEIGTGFSVGAGIPFRVSNSIEFCPLMGFYHQSLNLDDPDLGTLRLTTRGFSFGGSIGGVAAASSNFEVVPHASGEFVAAKGTASLLGESASESDSYFAVGVGAGFVVRRIISIRPSIAYAFGVEEADPVFSLAIGVNFGQAATANNREKGTGH